MQEPIPAPIEASLNIEDISPILGQHQLTIISQDKLIKKLQARITELETRPEPLVAQKDLERVPSKDGAKAP